MHADQKHPLFSRLQELSPKLTAKGRILNSYIQENPGKVVFMTIKDLARATGVSEATVFRFVRSLGYKGYNEFLQELRDVLDTNTPALARLDLAAPATDAGTLLHTLISEGIRNLQHFYKHVDIQALEHIVTRLEDSRRDIFLIGSRLSYIPACFLGWSLAKIRRGIRILKGSDSTSLDWLVNAEQHSLILMISTTRYPNELIRLGKTVKRLDQELIVIADSSHCPLLSFADLYLVTPSTNIPLFGDLTILNTLIRYICLELARRSKPEFTNYQNQLEQIYLENDIFFNLQQSK